MTKSEALAKILETYTEEELRDLKDEPDTIVNENGADFSRPATEDSPA